MFSQAHYWQSTKEYYSLAGDTASMWRMWGRIYSCAKGVCVQKSKWKYYDNSATNGVPDYPNIYIFT